MREAAHFQREVATASASASVQELAVKMTAEAVGCLVIVDEQGRPLGIVTDRDLALRVVADGRRAKELSAQTVMTQPIVAAAPTDSIEAVIGRMRERGIRRLPVVQDDRVVGLVSLDDLIVEFGRELDSIGDAVRRQFRDARRSAQLISLREELRERFGGFLEQVEHASQSTREALVRDLDSLRERMRRH